MRRLRIYPTTPARPVRAAVRRGGLILAGVALAGATCGSAEATASRLIAPDRRVSTAQSTTRVLKLVYAGSDMGRIVQHYAGF